jgi:hypothetical protein
MINWLLLFAPFAVALEHFAPERYLLIFLTSGLAILPLAGNQVCTLAVEGAKVEIECVALISSPSDTVSQGASRPRR